MALLNGRPSPARAPYWESAAATFAIEQLGYGRALITEDADWTLPPLATGSSTLVLGAFFCLLNPTAFQITLHAAPGDTIETPSGVVSSLAVGRGGCQLTIQSEGWLYVAALGTVSAVGSTPGPGETLIAGSSVKRLRAGTDINLTSDADSVTIVNALQGSTTTTTVFGQGAVVSGIDSSTFGFQGAFQAAGGARNTAFGAYSLYWNTTGSDNTAGGANAMGLGSISGLSPNAYNRNVALGSGSMLYMATMDDNSALGNAALQALDPTTLAPLVSGATGNVAIGNLSVSSAVQPMFNTMVGHGTLLRGGLGTGNTGEGFIVMLCQGTTQTSNNPTGNTAFGDSCMELNTSTTGTTLVASNSCYGANSGNNFFPTVQQCAAAGNASLLNTRTDGSTALGLSALQSQTTATFQAAMGIRAMRQPTGGSQRVAVGYNAGMGLSLGDTHTLVGYTAGHTITIGNKETLMGSGADVGANNHNASIGLGFGVTTAASNRLYLGSAGAPLTTGTTVGAAGSAAALPAKPVLYLFVGVNGTTRRIPLYNP